MQPLKFRMLKQLVVRTEAIEVERQTNPTNQHSRDQYNNTIQLTSHSLIEDD